MRVHEGRAGHVQAHRLEQHLVAVGGAVEGAGAGAVVGRALGLRAARRAPPGPARPARAPWTCRCSTGPVLIGPAGTNTQGRWPKCSAPISRPGHDLVAHARAAARRRTRRGVSAMAVPMAMVSRENRLSSMPGRPCVTPSHMAGTPPATCTVAPQPARLVADQRRVALVGLVRRQHVVVGGDDADVGRALGHDAQLVVAPAAPRRHAPRWRSPCGRCRARAGPSARCARR